MFSKNLGIKFVESKTQNGYKHGYKYYSMYVNYYITWKKC